MTIRVMVQIPADELMVGDRIDLGDVLEVEVYAHHVRVEVLRPEDGKIWTHVVLRWTPAGERRCVTIEPRGEAVPL